MNIGEMSRVFVCRLDGLAQVYTHHFNARRRCGCAVRMSPKATACVEARLASKKGFRDGCRKVRLPVLAVFPKHLRKCVPLVTEAFKSPVLEVSLRRAILSLITGQQRPPILIKEFSVVVMEVVAHCSTKQPWYSIDNGEWTTALGALQDTFDYLLLVAVMAR